MSDGIRRTQNLNFDAQRDVAGGTHLSVFLCYIMLVEPRSSPAQSSGQTTVHGRLFVGSASLGTATHSQDIHFMLADHFRDIEALSNRLDELGRHL
jgi:hypothetical protein